MPKEDEQRVKACSLQEVSDTKNNIYEVKHLCKRGL